MNKSQLVSEIYNSLNQCSSSECSEHKCTKVFAEKALNVVLDAIADGIKKDGNVQIVGFGSFSIVEREARMGVNPRTGDKIKIQPSKNIRFRAGAGLKEAL